MAVSRRALAGWSAVCLVSLPLLVLGGGNLILNLGLRRVVNPRPERLTLDWDYAWMVTPWRLHVRGLTLYGTGRTDGWSLHVDEVAGDVRLAPLWARRFEASEVQGSGVTFAYALRPVPEPSPRIASGAPWSVALVEVSLADVRAIDYGTYHLRGRASLSQGSVGLEGALLDLGGRLTLDDVAATHHADPLAEHLRGELGFAVAGLDRKANLGRAFFDTLSADAVVDADVKNLDFLHDYLQEARWLTVEGAGTVHADLRNVRGEMSADSVLTAEIPAMVVGFPGWEVVGPCDVRVDVDADPVLPGSRLLATFGLFDVRSPGSDRSWVVGQGFTLEVTTPDRNFREPFTALDVVLDLPPSTLPSFAPLDGLLPAGVGVGVSGGLGVVHGTVRATTRDNTASGDLFVTGQGVEVRLGDVRVRTDLDVHARLAHADLDRRVFDASGTRLALSHLSIVSPSQPDERTDDWSAVVSVPAATIRVGAPTWLDADLVLNCRDSVPFVTMFAERRALPGFVRDLLSFRDVNGSGHLSLGEDRIDLTTATFHGKSWEILLHLLRRSSRNLGALFVRLGPLSVGVGVDGPDKEIHVFGARDWYESGRPGVAVPADRGDRRRETRADRRAERDERGR